MKTRLLIILVCMTTIITANSQTAGYLGKRFVVNLDADFSMGYPISYDYNMGFTGNNGYLSFNCILSPHIEYTLTQKVAVGAMYHFFGTKFNGNYCKETIYDNITLPDYIKLYGNGAGLYFKFYMYHDNHAPFGLYTKFQFDWYHYQFDAYSFGPRSGNVFGGRVELGYDYLFFERLRLSWGVSVGLTDDILTILNSERRDFNGEAERKIRSMYAFSNKLTIGFLF
jgi:hypothetical protein